MALKLLYDENFNNDIIIGLRKLLPEIDRVRNQDVELRQAADPDVLAWAAGHDRILVTHDRQAVPGFARERTKSGLIMPGVFVVDVYTPIGMVIESIVLIETCGEPYEWVDQVLLLPF